MSTVAFKVPCLELTQTKKDWLLSRISEYARIYNHAAQFIPSLPEKYLEHQNPSELYTKWVKSHDDGSQLLKSDLLGGLQMFNAIKDACANFKTSKNHTEILEPNIIKFENSEYDIIKIERLDRKTRYALAVGKRVKGQREVVIPLVTSTIEREEHRRINGSEWGVIDHLELGMKMQDAKKHRDKELAERRKKNDTKVKEKIKAGLGVITYNFRDNAVSIPKTERGKKFRVKRDIDTFIGVDRGINNSVVLTAIRAESKYISGIAEYQQVFELPAISKHVFGSLRGLCARVVGVKIVKSGHTNDEKRRLRNIKKRRQEARKEAGTRESDVSETVSHQISAEVVKFAMRFQNPVVVFENLHMKKLGLRHKHGGKENKATRRLISRWDYGAIKRKSEYKLNGIGVWTLEVNPMFTSQYCSHCGAKGERDGIHFKCERCGLGIGSNPMGTVGQYNADVNASINIALKGLYSLYRYKEETSWYGYVVGNVADPNEQPDENVLKPIPTAMKGIEGTEPRRSETIAVCPENSGAEETKAYANRSTLRGSAQPVVKLHQEAELQKTGFLPVIRKDIISQEERNLNEEDSIGEVMSLSKF